MAKDVIFSKFKPTNPTCVMFDGSWKEYKSLCYNNMVMVKDKNNPKKYIGGIIVTLQQKKDVWYYEVKTNQGTEWKKISDFQTPRL